MKDRKRRNQDFKRSDALTRRKFLKDMGIIGAMIVFLEEFGITPIWADLEKNVLKMILVDYSKCTGCKTCEAVCSSFNNPVTYNGEKLPGLGNPAYSNIRVESFNPDVDIPKVCAMCPDTPCVKACPVEPDIKTKRKALYRDEQILTIKNDPEKCIGCGNCVRACAEQRMGVIELNPQTGKPRGICNLCGGDPQCVKLCPFDALSFVEVDTKRKFYGLSPQKIANELSKQWYGLTDLGGVR